MIIMYIIFLVDFMFDFKLLFEYEIIKIYNCMIVFIDFDILNYNNE